MPISFCLAEKRVVFLRVQNQKTFRHIVLSPAALIIGAALIFLIIAPLFQKGLFIDGYLYKTVAINFSRGDSTFWHMKFTNTIMPDFFEQPPFFFCANGWWFRLFGNAFFADKLFTVFLLGITFYLLYKLLRLLVGNSPYLFITLLFFTLLVQVWCWTFVNQVIETLVIPLSLGGTYFFVHWLKRTLTIFHTYLYALAFGLICYLLFLTKGFQSVFIAVLPMGALLVLHGKKRLLLFATLAYSFLAVLLVYTLFYDTGGQYWFSHYIQKRLYASLNNVGATTTNHFDIIFRTFTELLGPLGVTAVLLFFIRYKKGYPWRLLFKRLKHSPYALLFFFTALAGSFPFAITLEQRGFYLSPSFAFYTLGLMLWLKPYLLAGIRFLKTVFENNYVSYFSRFAFGIALVYLIYSPFHYRQNESMLKDVAALTPFLKNGDTVSIDAAMWNHVSLQSELFIRKQVSMECDKHHLFFLHDRETNAPIPDKYHRLNLTTQQFDLYVLTQRNP